MKERPPGYDKYIQSAQWRGISALMKKQAKNLCQDCGKPSLTLETHHLNYDRFGCERMSDLRVLCKPCHDAADEVREAEVMHRQAQAWDDACEAGDNRRYATYMTKKYGEHYECIEEDHHREEFETWRERKREREEDEY
jgi:hypothetical protein